MGPIISFMLYSNVPSAADLRHSHELRSNVTGTVNNITPGLIQVTNMQLISIESRLWANK